MKWSPIIDYVQEIWLLYYTCTPWKFWQLQENRFRFSKEVYKAISENTIDADTKKKIEVLIKDAVARRWRLENAYSNDQVADYREALEYQDYLIKQLYSQNTLYPNVKAELQLLYGIEKYHTLTDERIIELIDTYLWSLLKLSPQKPEDIIWFNTYIENYNNHVQQKLVYIKTSIDGSIEYEGIAPRQFGVYKREDFINDTKDIDIQKIKKLMEKRNMFIDIKNQTQATHDIIEKTEFLIRLLSHFNAYFTYDHNKAIQHSDSNTYPVFYIGKDRNDIFKKRIID